VESRKGVEGARPDRPGPVLPDALIGYTYGSQSTLRTFSMYTDAARSFEDRLNEVISDGTLLISGSVNEDNRAAAAGFKFLGVARNESGAEVHVFQRGEPAGELLIRHITRTAQDIAEGYGSGQNSAAMLFALRDKLRDAVQAETAMKEYRYCEDRVASSLDDQGPSAQVFFERPLGPRFSSVVIVGTKSGRLNAAIQLRDAQSTRNDKCYDENSQRGLSFYDQDASFSQFVIEVMKEVNAIAMRYEIASGNKL